MMHEGSTAAKLAIHGSKGKALQSGDEDSLQVHEAVERYIDIFANWQTKSLSEETFIKQALQTFLDIVFSNDSKFTYNW